MEANANGLKGARQKAVITVHRPVDDRRRWRLERADPRAARGRDGTAWLVRAGAGIDQVDG
jgi:hypothetical protein